MNDNHELDVDALYSTPDSAMGASAETPAPPTAGKRPTGIPFGVGLTLIICASLALAMGVPQALLSAFDISIADAFAQMPSANKGPFEAAKRIQAETKTMTLIMGVLYLGLSVYALLAGIWLKRYRRKGRAHALLWAKLALGYLLVGQIVFFTMTIPLTREIYASLGLPDGSTMTIATDVISVMFSAALPVIVLLLVGRKNVEAACLEP